MHKTMLTSIKIKDMLYKKYLQKLDIFGMKGIYQFYGNKINKLISESKNKSFLEVSQDSRF